MKCEESDHEAAESYCHFALLLQSVEVDAHRHSSGS